MVEPLPKMIAFCRFYFYILDRYWLQPLAHLTRHSHAIRILIIILMVYRMVRPFSNIQTFQAMSLKTLMLNPVIKRKTEKSVLPKSYKNEVAGWKRCYSPTFQSHSPTADKARQYCTSQNVIRKNWIKPSRRWGTFGMVILRKDHIQRYYTNRPESMELQKRTKIEISWR